MVKQNFLFIAIIVLSLAAYSVVPTFAAPVSALNTNLPNSSSFIIYGNCKHKLIILCRIPGDYGERADITIAALRN